jgi:hypothetical protein
LLRIESLNLKRILFGLILVLSIVAGSLSFMMVPVSPSTSSLQDFSAERAFKHIEAISLNPHPIGSDEIVKVSNYIINEITSLGLTAEIQETTVPDYFGMNSNDPVTIKNIYVVLPGTNPAGSIVLTGHYDTVPASPGANDDSSAVAALLETTRCLLSAPPLRNDIILLFTDAEEPGQYRYGARFFVENYKSINSVQLVLNFEALGCTGPSIMFETAPGNDWLIEGFAQSAPNPIAFSFMSDLYRAIAKGGTDFAAFEEAGINGLNFAYSFERTVYHTALDNVESLDQRSLQHHGDYALNLARYFGDLTLSQATSNAERDSVYHSLFSSIILKYPTAWAIPLVLVTGALLIYLVVMALRRGLITIRGITVGTALFFTEAIVITIVLTIAWWGIDEIHLVFGTVVEPTVKAHLLFVAFLFLTLVMMIAARTWLFKRSGFLSFTLGPMLFWWILAILGSIFLPGFNIILMWPLLFSLLPLGWVIFRKSSHNNSWIYLTLICISTIVSIILLTVPVYLLFQAMGTASPGFSGSPAFPILGLSIFFYVMLLGLLLPHFQFFGDWEKRRAIYGLLIIAAVFLILGCVFPGIGIESFGLTG